MKSKNELKEVARAGAPKEPDPDDDPTYDAPGMDDPGADLDDQSGLA